MKKTPLWRALWALSPRQCDLDTFLLRHGFHGPDEGQMASRVWREEAPPRVAAGGLKPAVAARAHPPPGGAPPPAEPSPAPGPLAGPPRPPPPPPPPAGPPP